MACQVCGRTVPTRKTTLYYNIGMLVARRHSTMQGELCRTCTSHYFWEYMLITGVLGWWGLISLVLTPIFLVNNLVQWLGSLRLAEAPAGAGGQPVSGLPQCPRCQAFHPATARPGGPVWASLVVSGILLVWAVFLTVAEIQGSQPTSNWGAIFFLLGIVGFALFSFIMLLRRPLARCAQCGYSWPAAS